MITNASDQDPLDLALASLAVYEPAGSRRAATRARAHQKLTRRRLAERRTVSIRGARWPDLVHCAVLTAALIYLFEVLRLAFHVGVL